MIETIVLAGGFGTRLREVVPDLPKPMAPVAGKPFLEIVLADLARKGVGRVIMSIGFMAEKIMSHFGNHYAGMDICYVVENTPLGTGGGVRLAMSECMQDHVFIFNGDTFLDLEIGALERYWQAHRCPTIVGREMPDTARYGRLLAENGRVIGFAEKGVVGPGLINAGCYVFCKGQLDSFPLNTKFSLENDYLAKLVPGSTFKVFITGGQFIDIGVPEDYARAQIELAGKSL